MSVKWVDTTKSFQDNSSEKIFTFQGTSSNNLSPRKISLDVAGSFVIRKHLTTNYTDHSGYFAGYKIKTTAKSRFKALYFSQGKKKSKTLLQTLSILLGSRHISTFFLHL